GFGDDPDARLGPPGTANDAADVIGIDGDGGAGLLGARLRERGEDDNDGSGEYGEDAGKRARHAALPVNRPRPGPATSARMLAREGTESGDGGGSGVHKRRSGGTETSGGWMSSGDGGGMEVSNHEVG